MNRVFHVTLLLLVTASIVEAQVAGTLHVFPQIADGKFADGTFYRSYFIVSNVTSTAGAACTVRLYGLSADRLSSNNFQFAAGRHCAADHQWSSDVCLGLCDSEL